MIFLFYVFSARILLTANKGMMFFRGKNDRPRKLTKPAKRSATATYFVPAPLLPHIERCREAMSALDGASSSDGAAGGRTGTGSPLGMNLVPVRAGDVVPLKRVAYGSKTR